MMSLKKRSQGFTVIELLIVIIFVVALIVLVITTYSGIQAKSRNASRQKDVQTIQNNVEAFFSQNGFYPSLADINSPTWRASNMKNLSVNVLVDPLSKCSPSTTACLTASPTAKAYSYAVTDSSGNSCEATDTNCAKYTLTATYEGTVNGSATYTKINLD
jgi:type II secretory pathway pseudopilin PulG